MEKTRRFTAYWKEAAARLHELRALSGAGVLAALGSALRSVDIPLTPTLRIGFSFLATGLTGFLYGPLVAGFSGMAVDIVGFMLRGGDGVFHPGFTFNAFVSGFIYGLWLYNKPVRLWRSLLACLCSMVAVSLVLNPLWLSQLYGKAYLVLVAERIVKDAITLPVNALLLHLFLQVAERAHLRTAHR